MKLPFFILIVLICLSVNIFSQDQSKAVEAYNRGLQLQNTGNNAKAILEYDIAIKANPKMVDAYNNRAVIKLAGGDMNGAIADFSKSIEIDKLRPLSYYNRGNVYLGNEQYDLAIYDFSKAIEIFNGITNSYDKVAHGMSLNNRGNALTAKGELKPALADYDRAILILPRSYEVLTSRGAVRQLLEDFAGAVNDYTKALEVFPDNALIYLNRAGALAEIDKKAAVSDYTKAIELEPTNAETYALRGTVLLSIGQKQEALADLRKAIMLDPALKPEYDKFVQEALKK